MTFSIVARAADQAALGVAVASRLLAVGAAVPAALADVGGDQRGGQSAALLVVAKGMGYGEAATSGSTYGWMTTRSRS